MAPSPCDAMGVLRRLRSGDDLRELVAQLSSVPYLASAAFGELTSSLESELHWKSTQQKCSCY